MSGTLILALLLIPCLVIAIVVHEVAHGWVANALGDPTAKERRRLTLNPIRHVDPVGTIAVPLALALFKGPIFGWAKPVPVLKNRLDNPRWGMVAVAAAGPGVNFAMAFAASVLLGILVPLEAGPLIAQGAMPVFLDQNGDPAWAVTALTFFVLINLFLGLFNLLPIPPFDGSHIVEGLLPRPLARKYEKLRPLGFVLFFALIALVWFAPQLRIIESLYVPVLWVLDKLLPPGLFFI